MYGRYGGQNDGLEEADANGREGEAKGGRKGGKQRISGGVSE